MINTYKIDKKSQYIENGVIIYKPLEFQEKVSEPIFNISKCIVNSINVFEEIEKVGKNIFINIKKNYRKEIEQNYDIYDLIDKLFFDNRTLCKEKFDEWVKNNGYPYSFEKYKEFNAVADVTSFLQDSLLLSIYYKIHLWILKIDKFLDTDEEPDLTELKLLLKLLNLKNDAEYIFDESIEKINTLLPDIKKNQNQLLETVRKLLLSILDLKLNKNGFIITKQTPIYIEEKGNYLLYSKAQSLMSIAYYQLLLNITFIDSKLQKICKNPTCINFVKKEKNKRYCDYCISHGIPELLKHRKYNASEKGIKRSERYYQKKQKEKSTKVGS